MASFADTQTDWEGLVTATQENADRLPSTPPHLTAMEDVLGDLKTMKALQGTHRAGKQKATQDMGAVLARGKELAIRLRGAITADLGPKSEELVNYGIVPARRRGRRPAVVVTPPTPPTSPEVTHTPVPVSPELPAKTNP